MACDSPIDCNTDISPEQAFRKLVKTGADGCPALNTVAVTAAGETTCDEFINCDNMNEQQWQQLFYQMITIDADGCWALRVIQSV